MATTQTRRDERLLIGGTWVEASGNGRFDVTNPANGEVVGSTPDATADDVRAAINAAAVSGVADAGLTMLVQPAAIAGPSLRVIIAAGKFHGVIAAVTPTGWRSTSTRLREFCAGTTVP